MKGVLISIKPKWCEKIANGEKTIEIRKNRPKLETPFMCYIYCTKEKVPWELLLTSKRTVEGRNKGFRDEGDVPLAGMVIGEFVCDNFRCFDVPYPAFQGELDKNIIAESCCTYYMLHRYAYHDALYGWHISALQSYDKPMKLSEYYRDCGESPNCEGCECHYVESNESIGHYEECCSKLEGYKQITRAPQSWSYAEVSPCK